MVAVVDVARLPIRVTAREASPFRPVSRVVRLAIIRMGSDLWRFKRRSKSWAGQ